MLRDAVALARASNSTYVFFVFVVNMIMNRMRLRGRIRHFRVREFDLYGATYCANSWDGLLALRPTNERELHALVERCADSRPGGVFVNVGAHVGRYCFEFADRFRLTVAFEPTPSTFDLLQAGWARHALGDRIRIVMKALSSCAGSARLMVSQDESKNSIVNDESADYLGDQRVTVSTLDDELTEPERADVRLVLIDVEGAEAQVLAGARKTLERGRPVVLVELLTPSAVARCSSLLAEHGYAGVQVDSTNWAFLHSAQGDPRGLLPRSPQGGEHDPRH